jgi:hypothetical protein
MRAVRRIRREPGIVALACVVALVAVGCSAGGHGATTAATSNTASRNSPSTAIAYATERFSDAFASFVYPATWRQATSTMYSANMTLLTFLSNEPLHDPCTTSVQGITCTTPIGTLGHGGVLATWTVGGLPGQQLDALPGKDYTFAHSRARVDIQHAVSPTCDESVNASFVYQHVRSHDELLNMQACIRGPGVQTIERQLLTMLDSTVVHRA